ncbi:MAG: alpha/beta fold hydrolase [Deltaproteobacteria bacterium]|nr:alpha/beta fold hydrolase [Deltaproteobacteria bacterium]
MTQRTVHFYSEGSRLEGDVFLPEGLRAGERRPGIVLCHGFTGVRELILPEYARAFVEAGYVALTFDYRGFGGSEGAKWRLIPLEQVDDIRNAITFLQAQPEVDPERIGLWGTSFGGAHAPYVAGIDSRVAAAVGQVGFADGEEWIRAGRTYSERLELTRILAADRAGRVLRNEGESADPLELALRDAQSAAFFPEALKIFPQLRCRLSWETVEKSLEYKPIEVVERIAPRGLLLIGAEKDAICPIEGYRKLYDRAREPKKLAVFPVEHFEMYTGEWFTRSSGLAIEWFDRFFR